MIFLAVIVLKDIYSADLFYIPIMQDGSGQN